MNEMFTIDLNRLKTWCKKYDKENGEFPESQFEGKEVYEFLETKISKKFGLKKLLVKPQKKTIKPRNMPIGNFPGYGDRNLDKR